MDALYRELLSRTRDPGRALPIEAAVDAALLGRFYERFADQSVDAARRIQYVITGTRNSPR